MKYAYQINSADDVVFCSGENIIFWKELSQKEYDAYIDARHNKNQIVYENVKGDLQIRDRDTIFDKSTNSWIPDVKAIRNKANNSVIGQAIQAYQVANLDRHQFSKLTEDQQKQLGKYLDNLLEIISIKESDKDLTLPNKPKFLK